MGAGYSLVHAADIAVMLPSESRVFVAENPDNIWTLRDRVLASIEYWDHVNVWMQTKDGRKKRNRPKPLFEQQKKRMKDAVSLDVDEYAERLAMPRKEVAHGN